MNDFEPHDRDHLLMHAIALFPGTSVDVIYAPDEIIYIDIDGHRYAFEIGSDDDAYIFSDDAASFTIPLMEIFEGDEGFA